MLVVALDTASPQGSLALARWDGAWAFEVVAEATWQREKSHSELLTATFENLLSTHQLLVSDIRAVFVGHGPGSFTGVRVGVSFARALGFSLGCPVWCSSSLRLWAHSTLNFSRPTLVVMRAFRDLVYVAAQTYENGLRRDLLPPSVCQIDELAKLLPHLDFNVVGDGWLPFLAQWPSPLRDRTQFLGDSFPSARFLFQIFVEDRPNLQEHSWKSIKPLYIRGSEAEEKLRQGVLKPVTQLQKRV